MSATSDHLPAANSINLEPKLEGLEQPAGATTAAEGLQRRPSQQWFWLSLNLCAASGVIAVAGLLWLILLPPAPDCEKLTFLEPDINRLYCAQTAAKSGEAVDLLAALNLVEAWGPDHPLYGEKQRWLQEWSEAILSLAQKHATENKLDQAVNLAEQVPPTSPLYPQAQASIQKWQTEWETGEAIYAKAQTAIQAKDWETASSQIAALTELSSPYWQSQQVKALSHQLLMEQQALKLSQAAGKLAQSGKTEDLRQAIAQAQTMDPTTHSWKSLQPTLAQWHRQLLDQGKTLWYEGRLNEAIAVGQTVYQDAALKTEAKHLVWLSQARQRAIASTAHWQPSLVDIWNLNRAIAIASRIPPDSRFSPQAVASIESWQQQLADLRQLYQAQVATQAASPVTYQYAIQQAAQITPERPRRLQAQTLIIHWQKEIERLADGAYLAQAKQLAAPGKVADLQQALTKIRQIAPGRVLYPEAQALATQWQQELQTLEQQARRSRFPRFQAPARNWRRPTVSPNPWQPEPAAAPQDEVSPVDQPLFQTVSPDVSAPTFTPRPVTPAPVPSAAPQPTAPPRQLAPPPASVNPLDLKPEPASKNPTANGPNPIELTPPAPNRTPAEEAAPADVSAEPLPAPAPVIESL
jgi:ribosomal protein L29